MPDMKKRTYKTTKVLSGVRTEYRAWKDWEEGDVLVCSLLGSAPNKKAPNKKDWIVEVVEAMFASKADNKKFKPGTRLTLNTAGMLDKGMAQIEEGEMVQITYNGQQEMKGGNYAGQLAHTMEVVGVEAEGDDEEELDDLDEESEDDEELDL